MVNYRGVLRKGFDKVVGDERVHEEKLREMQSYTKGPQYVARKRTSVVHGVKSGLYFNPRKAFVEINGCKRCPWLDTEDCPHYPEVRSGRYHSNRICSQRVKVVLDVYNSVDGNLHNVKAKHLTQMLDNSIIADKLLGMALRGEIDWGEALQWRKFSSEEQARWVKQVEGSKVRVEKKLNPSEIADLIAKADVVDAEVGKDGCGD